MERITKPIYGEMSCDKGLFVLPECLNQSYTSRATCFPLDITLPRLEKSEHEYKLLAPLSTMRPGYGAQMVECVDQSLDSTWGSIEGMCDPKRWEDPPVPTSVVIEKLGYVTEGRAGNDTEFQHTLYHFEKDKRDWWSRLVEWIGVVTSQDLIELGRKPSNPHFYGITMRIDDVSNDQEPGFCSINFDDQPPLCGSPLTRAQLDRCMKLAGNTQRPPLAWLLLRDARSLYRSTEYRRAILDAGTATELALTALIDSYAARSGNPELVETMRNTQMLGPKLALALQYVPDSVPDHLRSRVIKPRNRATHEGEQTERGVAEFALNAATELIVNAYPLSDFGFESFDPSI